MSAVLVLNPGSSGIPAWLRRALAGVDLSVDVADRNRRAVLVVNDHSARAAVLLRQALELRQAAQPVLVLTPVPAGASGLPALVRAVSLPGSDTISGEQAIAALRLERSPVRARVSEEAITFAYEA